LALSSSAAPADVGAVGSVDYATATPDWLFGNFAGSISYRDCTRRVDGKCRWNGWLMVQPTTASCDDRDAPPSPGDPSIVAATGEQSTDGTISFSEQSWPLLPGVQGQRLCLYLLDDGTVLEPNPACATDPLCNPPMIESVLKVFSKLAERDFTAEAQPSPPVAAGGGTHTAPVKQQRLNLSQKVAVSKAKAALLKRFGLKYKRGKSKRLSCTLRSLGAWRCNFSFRYKKKKRAGTVTVVRTPAGIATAVKLRQLSSAKRR
jgi:hypothetical protein